MVRIEHLRDGSRLGVISDLFTLEGARGVSVGEEVMDALIAWAGEQGCFGVDSVALPGDRHTKNFFESFGLVARAIVVHRSLAAPRRRVSRDRRHDREPAPRPPSDRCSPSAPSSSSTTGCC